MWEGIPGYIAHISALQLSIGQLDKAFSANTRRTQSANTQRTLSLLQNDQVLISSYATRTVQNGWVYRRMFGEQCQMTKSFGECLEIVSTKSFIWRMLGDYTQGQIKNEHPWSHDFNSQQIFMLFCKHGLSKKSQQPWTFRKLYNLFQKLNHSPSSKVKSRRPSL